MPNLATIARNTGITAPTLQDVINYVESESKPVAEMKDPLPVIAPVVNRLHTRARTMQFELSSDKLSLKKLKNITGRTFSIITDNLIILLGVSAPENKAVKYQLDVEKYFGMEFLETSFNLLMEIGGSADESWEAREISQDKIEAYAEILKELRKKYPLPEFSKKHNQKKRSEMAAGCGWALFIAVMLYNSGFLQFIFELIFRD